MEGMSIPESEEMSRTDVQHSPHKLKGNKEDLHKKAPETLKRKRGRVSRKRQRRGFFGVLAIFLFAVFVFLFLVYDHYVTYPGILARDSIHAVDRGLDYITLTWDGVRNAKIYNVYLKEHVSKEEDVRTRELDIKDGWMNYSTSGNYLKITGLSEATSYSVIVRPDSEKAEGLYASVRNFKTKSNQSIEAAEKITKLTASKPFKIDAKSETELEFESDNPEVAEITESGEIRVTGAGAATITVHAKETNEFVGGSTTVELEAIESHPVRAGGARAYTIYHLDSDNCEVVKEVTGADGHVVPQSFGYTGDRYIIAYGMSGQGRIVSYPVEGAGSEGKEVVTPKIAMSHPNGFTYADENKTCYSAKGWSSRVITYEPETGAFDAFNLRYGCSGIGYDRKEKLLYTSSRTVMAAYDIANGYSVVNTTGVVSHSGNWSTQDIGGHAGIMLRCLSPAGNSHGINMIDLYDMREGMYLGSLSCDLSEVESAIVNNDGFLEILANNSGSVDYIWRTNINVETLAEDIDYEAE